MFDWDVVFHWFDSTSFLTNDPPTAADDNVVLVVISSAPRGPTDCGGDDRMVKWTIMDNDAAP